ncbi:hypothetical protein COHA_010717 [Chlorella ohadii]|uniref:Uncharacterized protein n=1 Tax=Chlorella ohadii TaxID=2649997 RepID=A0AAD5GZE2_9CHLO|nr:hypothetical protein COHA_010717 [Chlorella ohadii]
MCFLCPCLVPCFGASAWGAYKTNKAVDKLFTSNKPSEPVEPAFVTDAKLKWNLVNWKPTSAAPASGSVEGERPKRADRYSSKELASKQRLAELAQLAAMAAAAAGQPLQPAEPEVEEEEEEEEEVEEEASEEAASGSAEEAEDPSDSEYSVGEDLEEQERARSRRGRGRPRTRPRSEELDSSEESDPEYMDSRARAKRRREPTPPGARRSSRIKVRGPSSIDVAAELADINEDLEPLPRRGLRSSGPVLQAPAPASRGPASRAGSEAPAPAKPKPSAVSLLPNPKDIRREHTEEEMAAELEEIRGMWEMASILDFVELFKRQLNLSRKFSATELEHVMAYSDGRDGLLADIHIDIMRGISPKQEVPRDQWAIHLANKIKFHWRPLLSGLHCPFKPDKYFEAYTYARLPAPDRVRALHFLCTIRCDREDIQTRTADSYMREWSQAELQLVRIAQMEAVRTGRLDDAPIVDLGTQAFRRLPAGQDSTGAHYYIFHSIQTTGFRLYRETPLPPLEPAKEGAADQEEASKPAVKQEAAAKPAAEQKAPLASIKQEAPASERPAAAAPAGPVVAAALQHGGLVPGQAPLQVAQLQAMMQAAAAAQQLPFLQAAAAAQQLPFLQMAAAQQLPFLQAAAAARLSAQQQPAAADSGSDEDESWWEEQARLAAYQVPPDPEQQPRWEVAATTLEEFEALTNKFAASSHPGEQDMAQKLRALVLAPLLAMRQEEERRIKALEAVQKKLGMQMQMAAPAASAAPGATGSGGAGAVAGGAAVGLAAVGAATGSGSAGAAFDDGARVRRARQKVNYAFNDYDETLRDAIRQTQRGETDSEDEGNGRRRRRRALSPMGDPVEAAKGGLRRGRSAAAVKE